MANELNVRKIFDLYRNHGQCQYIGEEVSQLEHACQCAMLAEQDGQHLSVRI